MLAADELRVDGAGDPNQSDAADDVGRKCHDGSGPVSHARRLLTRKRVFDSFLERGAIAGAGH